MITTAIIGLGNRGGMYGDRIQNIDGMQVVAICDLNDELREQKRIAWNVPKENCFRTANELFAAGKLADVLLICSPDRFHYEHAMNGLKLGYNLQLEKPIAQTLSEAIEIEKTAKEKHLNVIVCYVLRYSAYFRKIKDILENGSIGNIKEIQQSENVDFRHYCRSYVRGQWNKEETSTPFLMAKSSHDMDLLCWWADSEPECVSSLGDLSFYVPENMPKESTGDCRTCPLNSNELCRFNAYNTFVLKEPKDRIADKTRTAEEKERLTNEIPEEQFKCAFSAGNDVVDRQTVMIKMKNGVLCNFSAGGCRARRGRNMYIQGTKGEIYAVEEDHTIVVYTEDDKKTVYNLEDTMINGGHAGGDEGVVIAMHDMMTGKVLPEKVSSISKAIASQKLCVVAELSRKAGGAMLNVDDEVAKITNIL